MQTKHLATPCPHCGHKQNPDNLCCENCREDVTELPKLIKKSEKCLNCGHITTDFNTPIYCCFCGKIMEDRYRSDKKLWACTIGFFLILVLMSIAAMSDPGIIVLAGLVMLVLTQAIWEEVIRYPNKEYSSLNKSHHSHGGYINSMLGD